MTLEEQEEIIFSVLSRYKDVNLYSLTSRERIAQEIVNELNNVPFYLDGWGIHNPQFSPQDE